MTCDYPGGNRVDELYYRLLVRVVFSRDVTAAISVFRIDERTAVLIHSTNAMGVVIITHFLS